MGTDASTIVVAVPKARGQGGWVALGLAAVAVIVGAGVSLHPVLTLVTATAVVVLAAMIRRPEYAGYLLVGVTPLVVGIDRGRLVPGARPNEALLAACIAVVIARWVLTSRVGASASPPATRMSRDRVLLALAAMAVCNSLVPLSWMAVRGVVITTEDLLYALVLWKFLAVYVVVRATITTPQHVLRCLHILLASSAVVGLIAILQSLGALGVPQLLAGYYAPLGNAKSLANNRGSSTLALPAATADLMLLALAVVVGLLAASTARRLVLLPLGVLFVMSTLASGQFSAAIGLLVALVTLSVVRRDTRLLQLSAPVVFAAYWILQPVISKRLAGFQSVDGLPESWVGRLRNLRTYFWPVLSSDHNYVLGVRPTARVPGPPRFGIDWVWIESGYTWLLWGGGIPLLLAFFAFVAVGARRAWAVATTSSDPTAAAATAALVGLAVWLVLMLFDPHATYRGSGDIEYALLAMTAVGFRTGALQSRREPPTAVAAGRIGRAS